MVRLSSVILFTFLLFSCTSAPSVVKCNTRDIPNNTKFYLFECDNGYVSLCKVNKGCEPVFEEEK